MELQERHVNDVVVLDISGQLTLGVDSTRLKDKINSALHQGSRNILLNLGGVTYIDSGGLGQLVASFTTVQRENGSLKLFNLGQRSKDLLAMTKLVMVFDTFDTEQASVDTSKPAIDRHVKTGHHGRGERDGVRSTADPPSPASPCGVWCASSAGRT